MNQSYTFVSVVVPVYNEETTIGDDLKAIFGAMALTAAPYEVIVVDDGSVDGTLGAVALYPEARVVRHGCNLGVGAARRTGIEMGRGDVIVTTDGDGTYPNHEIPRLLAAMDQNDMVIGARIREAGTLPWLRRPVKALVRGLASCLTGARIPDLNSGLRCFRKSVAEQFLHLLPAGHSSESTLTMAFLVNGYRVAFVPIDYYPRRGGRSTFRPVRDTAGLAYRLVRNFGPGRRGRLQEPLGLLLTTDFTDRGDVAAHATASGPPGNGGAGDEVSRKGAGGPFAC